MQRIQSGINSGLRKERASFRGSKAVQQIFILRNITLHDGQWGVDKMFEYHHRRETMMRDLLLLAIDGAMRHTTGGHRNCTRWGFTRTLDFTNDFGLISSKLEHIQGKTDRLFENAGWTKTELRKMQSGKSQRQKRRESDDWRRGGSRRQQICVPLKGSCYGRCWARHGEHFNFTTCPRSGGHRASAGT